MATKTTPSRSKPRAQKPKPREVAIDVIVAKDETLAPSDRCMACEGGFEDEEVLLRIRDHRALVDYFIHRRCIIKILDAGPVDNEEFESYTARLTARYAAHG